MHPITITCLGHGGGLASAEIGNTAYLVDYRDRRILVDCGVTVPDVLHETSVDLGTITDVLITHCHADHVGGLERLLYHRRFISKAPPVHLVMGERTAIAWMAMTRLASTGIEAAPYCHLDLQLQDGHAKPLWDGTFARAFRTYHSTGDAADPALEDMPCYSFELQLGDHRIFFSGDRVWRHKGDAVIFEAMANADLVFHEIETFDTPSGCHTHIGDLDRPAEEYAKFWWGHHSHGLGTDYHPELKFARKGHVWRIDSIGPTLVSSGC